MALKRIKKNKQKMGTFKEDTMNKTPDVVIENKYSKPCVFCGEQVPERTGFAYLEDKQAKDKKWQTTCTSCYNDNFSEGAEGDDDLPF